MQIYREIFQWKTQRYFEEIMKDEVSPLGGSSVDFSVVVIIVE